MCDEFQLQFTVFHGCRCGVVAQQGQWKGQPIHKAWRLATDEIEISNAFDNLKCAGHPLKNGKMHAPCRGKDASNTENYTKDIVDRIHRAWEIGYANNVSHVSRVAAVANVVNVDDGDDESCCSGVNNSDKHDESCCSGMSNSDMLGELEKQGTIGDYDHRPKLKLDGFVWNTLVTKTLSPKDPLCRSPPALSAINDELASLRKEGREVWDEKHPIEFKDALVKCQEFGIPQCR
jgi:hypothetical protein